MLMKPKKRYHSKRRQNTRETKEEIQKGTKLGRKKYKASLLGNNASQYCRYLKT